MLTDLLQPTGVGLNEEITHKATRNKIATLISTVVYNVELITIDMAS